MPSRRGRRRGRRESPRCRWDHRRPGTACANRTARARRAAATGGDQRHLAPEVALSCRLLSQAGVHDQRGGGDAAGGVRPGTARRWPAVPRVPPTAPAAGCAAAVPRRRPRRSGSPDRAVAAERSLSTIGFRPRPGGSCSPGYRAPVRSRLCGPTHPGRALTGGVIGAARTARRPLVELIRITEPPRRPDAAAHGPCAGARG